MHCKNFQNQKLKMPVYFYSLFSERQPPKNVRLFCFIHADVSVCECQSYNPVSSIEASASATNTLIQQVQIFFSMMISVGLTPLFSYTGLLYHKQLQDRQATEDVF